MGLKFAAVVAFLAFSVLLARCCEEVQTEQIVRSICDFDEFTISGEIFNVGCLTLSSGQSITLVSPQVPRGNAGQSYLSFSCQPLVQHATPGGKWEVQLTVQNEGDWCEVEGKRAWFWIDGENCNDSLNCQTIEKEYACVGNLLLVYNLYRHVEDYENLTLTLTAL